MAKSDYILVVAADRGRARFFSIAARDEKLQELDDLLNADARMPAHKLASDRQGRVLKRARAGRAAVGRASLKEENARRFAHAVAKKTTARLRRKSAGRLFVFADAQFLGMLRGALRVQKPHMPVRYIAKNLTRASNRRIRSYLPKRLWPRRVMGIEV